MEIAQEYIYKLLSWSQSGTLVNRDVAGAVGDFNTISNFMMNEGALLVGLPTKNELLFVGVSKSPDPSLE